MINQHFRPIGSLPFKADPQLGENFGKRGKLCEVEVTDLVIDERYQRPLTPSSQRTLRGIVERFEWAKFGPIIVSRIEELPGKLAILDGQHRALAAFACGIETVPALVHDLSLNAQARVFRDVNAVVTAVSTLHLHHAGVIAGAPKAIGVDTACRAAGVVVRRSNLSTDRMKPNETLAVRSISRSLQVNGFKVTVLALAGLARAGVGMSLINAANVRYLSLGILACKGVVSDRAVDAFLFGHDLKGIYQAYRETHPGDAQKETIAFVKRRLEASKAGGR